MSDMVAEITKTVISGNPRDFHLAVAKHWAATKVSYEAILQKIRQKLTKAGLEAPRITDNVRLTDAEQIKVIAYCEAHIKKIVDPKLWRQEVVTLSQQCNKTVGSLVKFLGSRGYRQPVPIKKSPRKSAGYFNIYLVKSKPGVAFSNKQVLDALKIPAEDIEKIPVYLTVDAYHADIQKNKAEKVVKDNVLTKLSKEDLKLLIDSGILKKLSV